MLIPSTEVLLLAGVLFLLPLTALAESARLTSAVDLLAGPGRNHTRVGMLNAGTEVEVLGCRQSWCDVSAGQERGWVYGACLATADQGKATGGAEPLRRPPLVLGPGPVRSPYFNPSGWPGECPAR